MALSAQDMSLSVFRFLHCPAGVPGWVSQHPRRLRPHLRFRSVRRTTCCAAIGCSKALSLSHQEVAARLGAHRTESKTRWTITPIPSPRADKFSRLRRIPSGTARTAICRGRCLRSCAPVSLQESRFIELRRQRTASPGKRNRSRHRNRSSHRRSARLYQDALSAIYSLSLRSWAVGSSGCVPLALIPARRCWRRSDIDLLARRAASTP